MVTVENPIGTLSRVFHTHCTCACPSLSNACVQHSCTVIAALSGYAQQSFRCRTVIARPATCYVHDHLLSSGTVAWAAMPSLAHSAKHSRRTSFRCHRMFAPDFRKGVTQTDALQDYGVRFRAFGAAMKAKTASDAAARTPASTDGDAPNNSAEHEPSDARKIVNNIRQGTRTSAVLEKSGYHTMDEYCGSGLDIPVALRFVLQRLAAHVLEPEVLLFEATQLLEAALTNELIPCTVPCPACLRPYPILGARQHHRTCKRAPSVRATRPPQPGAEASEALPPAEFTP
eukprot:m.442650 g.442650  ORF g.442650 m.442650 type:complete len:287 (+) comp21476_c0_seq17:1883-2743(+)